MWHVLQLLTLVTVAVVAKEVSQEIQRQIDYFQGQLQDATLDVLSQYSEQPYDYSEDGPPEFNMPADFMHAFRPNTGVGNRENLIIDKIQHVPMFDDADFSKWQYTRFNNSDYFLGIGVTQAVLWQKIINPSYPLDFALEDGIFKYQAEGKGTISDAVMFVQHIQRTDILYVAILTENNRSSFISIYEIIEGQGMMITVVDLGINLVNGLSRRKLSHVQSRHGSALVVLDSTSTEVNIAYQQRGSNILNHHIEIGYPSAIALVAFRVGEHGYIAVANKTNCDIYKMDDFVQDHLLFERLEFDSEVIGLESFRLGFHRYLAVALADHQILYIWKPGGFFKAQELLNVGVNQIFGALLPNCRDDVILMLLKAKPPHTFLVWSGQQEKFIPSETENLDLLPTSGTMTSFSYGSTVYLLFVDKEGKSQLFSLDTHLSPFEDPVLLIGKEVSDLMQQLQKTIEEQAEKISSMSAVLVNAVRPRGDQHFTSMQVLKGIQATNEAHIGSIVNVENIAWEGSVLTLDEYLNGTDDLEARILSLEKELDELDALLPDLVQTDEDAVITGRKVFTGDVYAPSVVAQSLNIQSVGGINLPELQKQIYRLDKPGMIKGTLKFKKPLYVKGDLHITNTINGIDLSKDVLTTNTEQVSHAKMTFKNTLTVLGDLDILGKVNGIDIGSEVVTLHGNHVITGKKTFGGGIIAKDISATYVDGVNMDHFYSQALTKSGDQVVTAPKHFCGPFYTLDIVLSGKVNSYDINELAESIVRTDEPSGMAEKTFLQDVVVQNELVVRGTVNGLKIPDDLFLKSTSNVIRGKKDFLGIVYVDDINVNGTVGGLNLPSDVIVLSADETINGTIYFTNGISVEDDVIVGGLVDGVDLSELAKEVLKSGESQYIDTVEFTGPLTILGDLNVEGTVNGISIHDMVNDIIYKDDKDVVIKSAKHFRKLTANSVEVKKLINGYNINEDFMTVHGDQVIYDTKVFKKPVTFHSITTANDMIGGVNLTQLYMNRVTLSVEQEITSDLEFVDELIINGNLEISGTINGLKFPNDFVLTSTDQEIANKVFQGNVYVDNLIVDGNVHTDLFGGVKLPEFLSEIVTLSTDQVIEGDVYLGNVTADTVSISGTVNGINIVDFANNVMSLTKDQTVTAFKEFSAEFHSFCGTAEKYLTFGNGNTLNLEGESVIWDSVTTEKGVNGINLQDVNKKAVKLHGDNVITSPFTFADEVTFENLMVKGLINGVNLTQLDADSMKTEGDQFVKGVTTFLKGFHVEGDITAGTVNGMYLPNDVLTKTTPQVIRGTYTLDNLVVDGNMDVGGLVNGIDLSEVAPQLARIDEHNVIYSDLVFKAPVHVSGDINVEGLVNGIDMKLLNETAMRKSGEQHVTGHKILRGNVTVYGDFDVSFVNGMNWEEFIQDVVRIDIPQIISGTKVWNGDLEVTGDVLVTGYAEVGTINGISLIDFMEEAVFINQPANITGTKVFSSPVEISGDLNAELINNLRLKEDVITVQCGEDPQVITGQKTFTNLTVFGDIFVEGFVNGYKLPDVVANTLVLDGDQVITGHKTFTKPVKFLKNIYPQSVNGLRVGHELVTLDKPQDLFGNLVFLNDVHVKSDLSITGTLNGVDLVKLSNEALYTDTDQVIEGEFTIDHAVMKSSMFVDGDVNGLDLNQFFNDVNEFWEAKYSDLAALVNVTQEHCELARSLHSSLERSFYILDGFLIHQILNVSSDYISVHDSKELALVQLHDSSLSAARILYKWHDYDHQFHYYNQDQSSYLLSKTFTFVGHKIYIQIGVKARGSLVKINGVRASLIPRGFTDADFLAHENMALIVLLYGKTASCETYRMTPADAAKNRVEHASSLAVQGATSVAVFSMNSYMYLAVSRDVLSSVSDATSKIYCWLKNEWVLVQNVMASASSHVLHFIYHSFHYLAFTNSVPVYISKEPKSVQVYRNTGSEHAFELFQKISFDNAKKLSVFEFGGVPELYLTVFNETRVQILLLQGESGFTPSFTLHGKCISAVSSVLLDQELYLIVGQQSKHGQAHYTTVYKSLAKGSAVTPRDFTCS